MFDFDAGKLVIIGIVALVVIGPKDLPRVMRQVGQAITKMRRLASEFQGQFMEAMREADVADIKADVAKLADSAKLDVDFNPVREIRDHISGAVDAPLSVPPTGAEAVVEEAPTLPHIDEPTTADVASPPAVVAALNGATLEPSDTAPVPTSAPAEDAAVAARHGA